MADWGTGLVPRLVLSSSTVHDIVTQYCSSDGKAISNAGGEAVRGLRSLVVRIGEADDASDGDWSRVRPLMSAIRARGCVTDIAFKVSEQRKLLRRPSGVGLAVELTRTCIPTLQFLSFSSGTNCSMESVATLLCLVIASQTQLRGLEFCVVDTDPASDYVGLGFRHWRYPRLSFKCLQYLSCDWDMLVKLMRHYEKGWLPSLHYLVGRKSDAGSEYDVERRRRYRAFETAYGSLFPKTLVSQVRTFALTDGLSLTKQMALALVIQFPLLESCALGVSWKEGVSELSGDHTYFAEYFLGRLSMSTPKLKRLCIRAPGVGNTGNSRPRGPAWHPDRLSACLASIQPGFSHRVWVHPNRPDGSSFARDAEPPLGAGSRCVGSRCRSGHCPLTLCPLLLQGV